MRGIKNLSFGFGLKANTKILKKTNNNPLSRLEEDEDGEEDNEEEDTDNESEIVELNNVKQRKTGKVAFGLQS